MLKISVNLCYLDMVYPNGIKKIVFCVKIIDWVALEWLLDVMLGCADYNFMLLGKI